MVKSADSGQIAKARARQFWGKFYGTGPEYADEGSCDFAMAFAASERQAVIEECAKVVEEFTDGTKMFSSRSAIAAAIRSME